jgi:heme oxygenase
VHNLKEEVAEALRRQLKEVSKKQESLEMLMEELQDKNDFIDELKSSVSFLESKMKSKKNGLMSSMLDEDK